MNEADKALAAAKEVVRQRDAEERCKKDEEAAELRKRDQKFHDGSEALSELRKALFARLAGVPRYDGHSTKYASGDAALEFHVSDRGPTARVAGWNILAYSPLILKCSRTNYTRSTTLFVGDSGEQPAIYEVSFCGTARGRTIEPFWLPPDTYDFEHAMQVSGHAVQRAFGPEKIGSEDQRKLFLDRWVIRFAKAVVGELMRPTSMPSDD